MRLWIGAQTALGEAADKVKIFDNVEAFAAQADVDAVVVASPNFTHRAVLEPLLARDVAILYEARNAAPDAFDGLEIRKGVPGTANRFVSGPSVLIRRKEKRT